MQKRLYRSRDNKIIAGICAGLAEYFAVDPVLVRVLFVAMAMLGGPGVMIYIILYFVMPEQPSLGEKVKNTFDE